MTWAITAARLRAAVDIIGEPEWWSRGATARDAHGDAVAPTSPRATHFSALGAVLRATWDLCDTAALDAIDPARPDLTRVNDEGGHAAAIAELRRLAALAEAQEGAAQ